MPPGLFQFQAQKGWNGCVTQTGRLNLQFKRSCTSLEKSYCITTHFGSVWCAWYFKHWMIKQENNIHILEVILRYLGVFLQVCTEIVITLITIRVKMSGHKIIPLPQSFHFEFLYFRCTLSILAVTSTEI